MKKIPFTALPSPRAASRYLRQQGVHTTKKTGERRVKYFAPEWAVDLYQGLHGPGPNLRYALRRAQRDPEFRSALTALFATEDRQLLQHFIRGQRGKRDSTMRCFKPSFGVADDETACGEPPLCWTPLTQAVTCEACKNTQVFAEAARSLLPPIGTSIWRGATYTAKTCTVDPWEPVATERGDYVFRANHDCGFSNGSALHTKGPEYKGLVCICRAKKIDPWWTHFEVTGHTKKGTAVFVKPVYGAFDALVKTLTEIQPYDGKWERVILPAPFANKPKDIPAKEAPCTSNS